METAQCKPTLFVLSGTPKPGWCFCALLAVTGKPGPREARAVAWWESGSEADTGESPRGRKGGLQAELSELFFSGSEYFKTLILTSVGLPQSVEVDQRPDRKFKQSFIWANLAA